jgi:hypothetical protein
VNQNDIEMLQKAYHYNTLMQRGKPHLDQWVKVLTPVMKNPNDPNAYGPLQILTGKEDPDKAYALATQEYTKLRQQHDLYGQNFSPLNDYLTERGITPDQYGDEAMFIQLLNRLKFQPHTPRTRRWSSR